MAQEWYYTQGDRKVGPVSAKELGEAAKSGKLQPTDMVWTDGMKDWKEARSIKGLESIWPIASLPPVPRIAKPVAVQPTPPNGDEVDVTRRPSVTSGRSSQPSALPEFAQQWWLIGLSMCCCFPVGLILV
jgi:GYF domain 2